MPSILSIGNWYTWEEAYVEIITQVQRFVKAVSNKFNMSKYWNRPKLLASSLIEKWLIRSHQALQIFRDRIQINMMKISLMKISERKNLQGCKIMTALTSRKRWLLLKNKVWEPLNASTAPLSSLITMSLIMRIKILEIDSQLLHSQWSLRLKKIKNLKNSVEEVMTFSILKHPRER